jgi:ribosomal protein S18 acetylase RimI-like enzyme
VPILIAEDQGEVAGFIAIGPCRDQDAEETTWEIWAMYLAPQYWSQGVGRTLWQEARAACIANGATAIKLWVIVGNETAMRFYRAAGFEAETDAPMSFELGGVTLQEIRMAQPLI